MTENRETRWPEADGVSLEPYVTAELVDPSSGELLEPTPGNAATVRILAQTQIEWLTELKRICDAILDEESRLQGTSTFTAGNHDVVMSGGERTEYDAVALMENLRSAGLPEERVSQAVTETVSYKPNKRVLKHLAAANEDYAAAIELASYKVTDRRRATIK